VAITGSDYQRTALTPDARVAPAEADDAAPDVDRVGIVFVHGIGTQQPAETFLEWSAPIVRLLTAWRIEHGFPADPVVRSEFSFSGSSQPYLEIEVPALPGHPARRWVMTEAWWAAQVRAPALATMTGYVRRGLPRILQGIRDGYRVRTDLWTDRLNAELAAQDAAVQAPDMADVADGRPADGRPAQSGPADAGPADAGPAEADSRREARRERLAPSGWAWIDRLDSVQKSLTVLSYLPALVLGSIVLLVYAPLRMLPIKALRDAAILRSADNFLTTWFGDLPDLLDDPVQSANVRARVAESIDRLRTQQRCGSVVLIAHSGGAIVSFTTLLDPVYLDRPVDKLITLGQGLALGWRLDDTGRPEAGPRADRLTGDILGARPSLRWSDTWASYDPAPGGPIVPPLGVRLKVESRPVTNRMSILGDHGGYWDNDEGFLVPLVRHLDEPKGDPNDSRFYRDSATRVVRIERRRQRVAILASWRWIVALGGLVPIVVSTIGWAISRGRVGGPALVGSRFADWWSTIPGHELVSGPLDLLAGTADYPRWFGDVGKWILGSLVIGFVFWIVYRFGASLWARWDERERAVARLDTLGSIDRRDVVLIAALLVLFTFTLSAAALKAAWG
jgi:hypothetical protein